MNTHLSSILLLLAAAGAAEAAQQRTGATAARIDLRRNIHSQVLTIDHVLARDRQELQDLDAKGPLARPVDLESFLTLRGLEDFPGMTGAQDLLNLSLKVFPDANPDSGIYYYYPAGYFLNWDPDTGYYLALDYKYAQESGDNVVIDARLSPGSLHRDRQLLLALLKAYLERQPGMAAARLNRTQLFELPARYEVEFDWTALGAAEATVAGIDAVSRQIALTLTTDVPTREILVKKLGDGLGLHGRVRIVPEKVTDAADPPSPLEVGARLMLTDGAYADRLWQRDAGRTYSEFRNPHEFPVKLKSLCYLYRDGNELRLRGYRLGERVLAPGGVARIPNVAVTAQIDDPNRVLRAWYDYSLVNDRAYRQQVVDRLTGGVGQVPVKQVAADVLRPAELFEQYHLHRIVVIVRSRHFDPEGQALLEKEYELTPEDSRRELDPLYVSEESAGEPLYEYRIGIITETGEQFLDASWRTPGVLGDITIGSLQVEEVMSR